MKRYTIGALFTPDFRNVLLIKKQRPEWQKGKFNLPGGHIEKDESDYACVSREFKEECGVLIPGANWRFIGRIENKDSYTVGLLTAIYNESAHGPIQSITDEFVEWAECASLPGNCISNLHWIVPFAINTYKQGNHDELVFGLFSYEFTSF